MSKEDLVSALLYLNGYDAKTPVKTDNIDFVPKVIQDIDIVEFYKDFEDASDKVIIDIGDNHFIPTLASLWKIEQYRELDGSPYLAVKRPTKQHRAYWVIEETEEKLADFNWSTTEVTTSTLKAQEPSHTDYEYDFWNSASIKYRGQYTDDTNLTDLD